MAQDNDDINEARRKAMRNGEEDPVVVAQRYLNIYRQMHIFPPERKEAFDKMLLELPSNICSIFSSLPGGLMLQDYVNDLAEKHGMNKTVQSQETENNAPILETALSQNVQQQAQPAAPQPIAPQPVQVVQSGNMEVSLGKDFATQFAEAFDGLLKQQSVMQAESLEKISDSLSKNQLAIVQHIDQNKESEQQAFAALAKALEQRQMPVPSSTGGEINTENNLVLQQLIEGQKEINLRLNKMESTALSSSGADNQELISALVKSNTEAMQKMVAMQSSGNGAAPVAVSDNTENLLKLIEQSQAQLIEGVVQRIMQNNVAIGQSQANNNANNIQINTPDTSAQTIMLVNKIADLQAANEKNMEEAITRLIEAQKEIYEKLDNNRSQEIADAIVKGLQSSSLTINNFVPTADYAPRPQNYSPANSEPEYNYDNNHKINDLDNIENQNTENEAGVFNENSYQEDAYSSSENNEVKEVNDIQVPDIQVPEQQNNYEVSDYASEEQSGSDTVSDDIILEENKAEHSDNYNSWIGSSEQLPDNEIPADETLTAPDMDEPENGNDEIAVEKDDNINIDSDSSTLINNEQPDEKFLSDYDDHNDNNNDNNDDDNVIPVQINDLSSSSNDWGFDDEPQEEQTADNIEKETEAVEQYNEVEMIGNGSYIYLDDLSEQKEDNTVSPVIYNTAIPKMKTIPQIYDDSDDDGTDPYDR